MAHTNSVVTLSQYFIPNFTLFITVEMWDISAC